TALAPTNARLGAISSYTLTILDDDVETTITSGPPANSNSTTATFSFGASKAGATFECQLDGAAFAACPATATFSGLAQGPHTLAVRARTTFDTVDPTPATQTFNVDTITPETDIVFASKPPADTNSTSATFDFAGNEPGVTYECNVDGKGFVPCPDP